MIWVVIGIGGALGAAARFIIGNLLSKRAQQLHPFPLSTNKTKLAIIYVVTSIIVGIVVAMIGFYI